MSTKLHKFTTVHYIPLYVKTGNDSDLLYTIWKSIDMCICGDYDFTGS